jgi:isopenicillin-N N-acyltransferase like protein
VLLYIFWGILVLVLILLALFALAVLKTPPKVPTINLNDFKRTLVSENFYTVKNSWIRKNDYGLWEMYIEGDAYQRGLMNGILASELIYNQEKYFVAEIKKKVPNRLYLFFLKLLVAWMNRKLNFYIGKEYNQEIYGISRSASLEYSYIGPRYIRILNYHAAHDIGHTLQYMNFVGCTSFATWDNQTEDGKLIHGRNFDFHAGDEFSEEKIVTFYNPSLGNKFAMITWGGMVGTVSGMNIHGIAITVNAAKSKLPMKSSTPITILVRELLQYAETIEEAIEIAEKSKIFVSEAIHVSSGKENKSVLIEKTPYQTAVYTSNDLQLICTNHFQSEKLKNDPSNLQQIDESSSMKRYQRVKELLKLYDKISVHSAVEILRDRLGTEDKPLGSGNEIAINQLIAHHSVIFKPAELKMWISAGPYTLGEYLCYDLNTVFNNSEPLSGDKNIITRNENIAKDEFLSNGGYTNYIRFKKIRKLLKEKPASTEKQQQLINEMIALNPDSYLSYSETGDLYMKQQHFTKAIELYTVALQKLIPTRQEIDHIHKGMEYCKKKINHKGGA